MKNMILAASFGLAAACGTQAADLEFLKELVEIPSSSEDYPQVNRAMDAMKAYLEKRGVICTVETREDGRKLLFAATKPGKEQDFILSTHLDVVPAAFPGHYAVTEKDGKLMGRGVGDDKGACVAVAKTLCDLVGTDASVGCIFGADEEIGGVTTTWMVVDKGYRPRKMVLVVDGPYRQVSTAQKGQLMLNVAMRGRSGHSSRPWLSDDSITKLMRGYVKLRDEWDRRHPLPEDKWSDVLTPTVVKSEGEALNRIPALVELNLNLRSVRPEAKDELIGLCKDLFAGAEVKVVRYSPPCMTDPDDPLVRRLAATMSRTFGGEVPFGRMLAATDARCFVTCGVPTVILGTESRGAHGAEECTTERGMDMVSEYLTAFFLSEAKQAGK